MSHWINDVLEPPPQSPHHEMYTEAVSRGDEVMARRASIGGEFDGVRQLLAETAVRGGADATVDVYYQYLQEPLRNHVSEQTAALQEPARPDSTRRLNPLLYPLLADHLALLPVLFSISGDNARTHRDMLISKSGIYGILAEALRTMLWSARATEIECRERAGSIHEITTLCMLDRPQSEDRVALLGTPAEDEKAKCDILIYTYDASGRAQIMSRQATNNEHDGRKGGPGLPPLIGGCAIGNGPVSSYWSGTDARYRTAEAIIAEVDAVATDEQVETLGRIEADLLKSIESGESFVAASLLLAS